MKYLLFMALCTMLSYTSMAQQNSSETLQYQYYIKVSGVNTKQTIKSFIDIINTNKKIKSIRAFGISKDNFLLSSNEELSIVEISSMLVKSNFALIDFTKGPFTTAFLKQKKQKTIIEKKN